MTDNSKETTQVVLVRTHRSVYALSLENVVETMRPLPLESVSGMPSFLRGLAIIRGEPVPVVDLSTLFDGPTASEQGRFVLLNTERRPVALAVEAVLGVFRLERSLQQSLPPLLKDANATLIAAVSIRDKQLLLVLEAAHLVPEAVWRELESKEKVS